MRGIEPNPGYPASNNTVTGKERDQCYRKPEDERRHQGMACRLMKPVDISGEKPG